MMATFLGASVARWPIITATELRQAFRAGAPAVVDASWYLPAMGRNAVAEYSNKRIPRAVFWEIDGIADKKTTLPHMLPPTVEFAQHMSKLGIAGPDAPVVVYDGHGFFSAARAWWTLRTFGATHAVVLDGGLPAWEAAGGAVETGQPAPVQPAAVSDKWALNLKMVADMGDVRTAIHDRASQGQSEALRQLPLMVDARPAGRFVGKDPEPRQGLRSGHAPTSRSLPFNTLLDASKHNTLLPNDKLRDVLMAAGVDPSRPGPIITSCGSGVTASVIFAALAALGRPLEGGKTALYDGSWAEWASMQGKDGCDIVSGPAEDVPADML